MRKFSLSALIGVLFASLLLTAPVQAQQADPAATTLVDSFNHGLIAVMKDAKTLGFQGRVEKLTPLLKASFNFPEMARIATGSHWKTFSDEQKAAVTDRVMRLSAATYASRLTDYAGEKSEILSITAASPPDVGLVANTHLVDKDNSETKLVYRLRQADGGWKLIDVFYNGDVSELASWRSQYVSVLKDGGYAALIAKFDERIADLGKSGK